MILRQHAIKFTQSPVLYRHILNPVNRRHLGSTAKSMVSIQDIAPSANEDPDSLATQTTDLVDNGRWRLCNEGKGLERVFKFKTFKATWDFMNAVAAECKAQKHHPEWTNIYNRTQVRWTTHKPEGLSSKDITMARFCDQVGKEKAEVVPEAGEDVLWDGEARECCGGKK